VDWGSVKTTSFLWLEITGKCQLECVHCYADSGPAGTHGAMTTEDWIRLIEEAAELGVQAVQFIGGEPTLHPDLPRLIEHALGVGIEVEVFSNLVHVAPTLWKCFQRPGVRLACSYYSDRADQHAAVTGRTGSHTRTRSNILEAIRRSIPLRVGVVGLTDDQRTEQAMEELRDLGVSSVSYDHIRQFGRGVRDQPSSTDQLCGHCADGVLAISPTGEVWPCVFSRWLPVGNVRDTPLSDIIAGTPINNVRRELSSAFAVRPDACLPDMCDPQCGPNCSPACLPQGTRDPCGPRGGCMPNYDVRPLSGEPTHRPLIQTTQLSSSG
jgi:MoaA/NifB/PqqE/SkfB family radical SAM enzyme